MKVNAPMCNQHFEAAGYKGTAERLVGVLGIPGGIVAWIVTLIMLSWVTGQPGEPEHLPGKVLVSCGAGIVVWAIIAGGLAPRFAKPASKEARNAVTILEYSSHNQSVRLEFRNESLADIVQRESAQSTELRNA